MTKNLPNQILPSYDLYRQQLIKKGITFPLDDSTVTEYRSNHTIPAIPEKNGWPWTNLMTKEDYDNGVVWPRISVISPSFNQGMYLEETIRSVLGQNYPNLEYIVIDGGSNDRSPDIIRSYRPWLNYWQSEKDRGQSHAINTGFSLASGDIYCWINSDDYFLRGTLKKIALTFLSSKADFVYGNCYNLHHGKLSPVQVPVIFDRYLKIPGLAQPSVFWKKSIHQPIWEELDCTLDFELWMRMAAGVKRKYVPDFLSVARIHDNSKTHSIDKKQQLQWEKDHKKQWEVHGEVTNWNRLVFENNLIQRFFRMLPWMRKLF